MDLNGHIVTIVFLLSAVVGGIVVVVEPSTLSFEEYLTRIAAFGGLLGIGRGLAAQKNHKLSLAGGNSRQGKEYCSPCPPHDWPCLFGGGAFRVFSRGRR